MNRVCVYTWGQSCMGGKEVNGGGGNAGKAGEWQKVMKLSSDMQRSGVKPDVWTYASLIAACQSCGNRWREALNFYQDMQDKGVRSCNVARDLELRPATAVNLLQAPFWHSRAVSNEGKDATVLWDLCCLQGHSSSNFCSGI